MFQYLYTLISSFVSHFCFYVAVFARPTEDMVRKFSNLKATYFTISVDTQEEGYTYQVQAVLEHGPESALPPTITRMAQCRCKTHSYLLIPERHTHSVCFDKLADRKESVCQHLNKDRKLVPARKPLELYFNVTPQHKFKTHYKTLRIVRSWIDVTVAEKNNAHSRCMNCFFDWLDWFKFPIRKVSHLF